MLRPSLAVLAVLALTGAVGAQADGEPPCPPGVGPAATIRGFDTEDGGGSLTATHTIGLEARDRNGFVPNVSFTLPDGAQARGTEHDPAFSIDSPGRVQVAATWSHNDEEDGSTCTASAQGTLRIGPTTPLDFSGLPPGPSALEYFQAGIKAGKNADLRPVQLRLRGVRRARLPGPKARLQTVTLPLRRGDAGLPLGRARTLRAARWRFIINFVDDHQVIIGGQIPNTGRGRRGPSRGYGFSIVFVQAGHRIGRIRATGRCGYLGCLGRVLP